MGGRGEQEVGWASAGDGESDSGSSHSGCSAFLLDVVVDVALDVVISSSLFSSLSSSSSSFSLRFLFSSLLGRRSSSALFQHGAKRFYRNSKPTC